MQVETEVKFLNINHNDIRKKLELIGAHCKQPMRLMRRAIVDYPDRRLQSKQDGWIRVRDEGDKITLTYKQIKEMAAEAAHEIELTVSSYEKAVELFEIIGLKVDAYQESRRETWTLGECEIVLDEWPWLKPYIEIEGPNEWLLREIAQKLELSWDEAVFGSTTVAYAAEYPGIKIDKDETIAVMPEMRFGNPLPDWLAQRTS